MINRLFICVVLMLASSFLFAQEAPNVTDAAGKKQGHWIKLDDNKKKIYEGNFVNNIPVGKFTYYYDTGIPWSITHFSQNGKVARTQMFNAAGKLMGEGKYVNEKKDSLWKFYNDEGKLISEEGYVNGLKHGSSKVFYVGGQLSEEKIWKNGKLDGPVKKYFENGQLKYIGQYINDKVEGKVVFYFASGKVNAEGAYKNDLKEGTWKYYTEDGKVERTDIYVNGRMTGTDKDVLSKEEQDKERKKYEQFEIKDPYEEGYRPE
jgi:antitoxin component YwqK of YwqJK toxin-antitoxin module